MLKSRLVGAPCHHRVVFMISRHAEMQEMVVLYSKSTLSHVEVPWLLRMHWRSRQEQHAVNSLAKHAGCGCLANIVNSCHGQNRPGHSSPAGSVPLRVQSVPPAILLASNISATQFWGMTLSQQYFPAGEMLACGGPRDGLRGHLYSYVYLQDEELHKTFFRFTGGCPLLLHSAKNRKLLRRVL